MNSNDRSKIYTLFKNLSTAVVFQLTKQLISTVAKSLIQYLPFCMRQAGLDRQETECYILIEIKGAMQSEEKKDLEKDTTDSSRAALCNPDCTWRAISLL